MTDEKKAIDWEQIKLDYRCSAKPLRLIAKEHGITHGAITQRAKKEEWPRDLDAKIRAKAKSKLSKSALSKELSAKAVVSESRVVEANAELQYQIQMEHRSGLSRLRSAKDKLLTHITSVIDNFDDLAKVIEMVREPDDNGQDRANDKLKRAMDRSSVIDDLKKLAEIDEKVRKGEREAFGIDDADGGDNPVDSLLRKIYKERIGGR
jgi:hypothetical protein